VTSSTLTEGVTVRNPEATRADPSQPDPARFRVGLVAPLPPQVGGVTSIAEWLLARQDLIGCCYQPFDLFRPANGEAGGRLRSSSVLRQIVLMLLFFRWLRTAPRLVHYCVACSRIGLPRDLAYLGLLRLTGRATIGHIHGAELGGRQHSRFLRGGMRLVGRLTVERVAIAPGVADTLEGLGVSSCLIVNPVRIGPVGEPARSPSATLRLLLVGTYGERKGCFDLVEALARARARGVDVTIRFVGREEYHGDEARLAARARAFGVDGRIEFSGTKRAEELAACYENADVVCLPSYRELLPMALLEGMAFALPVLASPVGGIPDLVEDGRSGFLVEPGDVDGLTRGIESLAADPLRRREMGVAARERALMLTNPERLLAQWRALYIEVGRRGGRRRRRLASDPVAG
jgi:glycosyltransferase involved in cell wall biosynthesis